MKESLTLVAELAQDPRNSPGKRRKESLDKKCPRLPETTNFRVVICGLGGLG
jgi:hypothetical protein